MRRLRQRAVCRFQFHHNSKLLIIYPSKNPRLHFVVFSQLHEKGTLSPQKITPRKQSSLYRTKRRFESSFVIAHGTVFWREQAWLYRYECYAFIRQICVCSPLLVSHPRTLICIARGSLHDKARPKLTSESFPRHLLKHLHGRFVF